MTFLEDDILRLRAVEPGDASLMWEAENDTSQWRDNGMSAPYSRRNIEEYALGYDADPIRSGQLRLICELKSSAAAMPQEGEKSEKTVKAGNDKKVVGLLDLYEISAIGRTAFVGIYIMNDHRGYGYASRSLALAERYARQLLNLRILGAKVAEGNRASQRLFAAAGYTLAGTLKDWLLNGPTTRSLHLYTKSLK